MRRIFGGCVAVLLGVIGLASTSLAQGLPAGSYLRSCNGVRIEGDTLIARCRRVDGFEQRSVLNDVHRCVGDIANDNGELRCAAYRPGPPPGPPPGFAERCADLRHQAFDLRTRIDREWNPIERGRLEERLRGVRYDLDRCPR
jgi:hypothetical protein